MFDGSTRTGAIVTLCLLLEVALMADAGFTVTTLAGAVDGGSADGVGTNAGFNGPVSISLFANGTRALIVRLVNRLQAAYMCYRVVWSICRATSTT